MRGYVECCEFVGISQLRLSEFFHCMHEIFVAADPLESPADPLESLGFFFFFFFFFWFTWFVLDGGICGRGIVCPTVRHRHFSYNGYLGTWVWAVLASSVALAAALSSHCFWTFFIAASKKASDERFFAAALTFG